MFIEIKTNNTTQPVNCPYWQKKRFCLFADRNTGNLCSYLHQSLKNGGITNSQISVNRQTKPNYIILNSEYVYLPSYMKIYLKVNILGWKI